VVLRQSESFPETDSVNSVPIEEKFFHGTPPCGYFIFSSGMSQMDSHLKATLAAAPSRMLRLGRQGSDMKSRNRNPLALLKNSVCVRPFSINTNDLTCENVSLQVLLDGFSSQDHNLFPAVCKADPFSHRHHLPIGIEA